MQFDIAWAEAERMKSLGPESAEWNRYVRIRDWVVNVGHVMNMRPEDEDGWKTFVLTMEAFPSDPEPADTDVEEKAKQFLRIWMEKGQPELLDVHEAVLFLDDLMDEEGIPPDEALDRMGNLKELPFSDEIMAALIAVVPQSEPDLSDLQSE